MAVYRYPAAHELETTECRTKVKPEKKKCGDEKEPRKTRFSNRKQSDNDQRPSQTSVVTTWGMRPAIFKEKGTFYE